MDVVETEQLPPSETASTVSYPSQDLSVVGELSCVSSVESVDHGCDNQFLVIRKETSWCRVDSGAQLRACPLAYPGHKIPLPDPGIHTADGARLQHDAGRLVTYKLPRDEQSELR